jgi:hypothetical protein
MGELAVGEAKLHLDQNQPDKVDVSISAGQATKMALALIPIFAVVVLVPHWLIWGGISFVGDVLAVLRPIIVIPVFIISVFVHEALHGLGFVWFGHLAWRDVRFGFHWKALAPYAHCQAPLSAGAYRGAVLLPGLMLGVIPALIGVIIGLGGLSIYSIIMLMAAGGDFVILWVIRCVPASSLVLDHAERPGCWILTDQSIKGEI